MRFEGKVALVSGAASGIGAATAARLADEGATVHGIDIQPGALVSGTHDVSKRQECMTAVEDCVSRHGRLDVLCNVAGIARAHRITDVTEDEWRQMFGVNVDGVFWMSQAALPHLRESGGAIVNVASNAGLMGQAYTVPYCATKGAVVQLTRAMAMEVVKESVRINAVAPGGVDTPLVANYETPADIDFELMQPYVGFRGMGTAEDIAAAIAFLASDEASRVHGAILSVDAGLTAG